jgi:hypothetical protein
MKEEENELVELLKILVDKVSQLEETVYNEDNILMKSGFVKTSSPTPRIDVNAGEVPDASTIAKMSWDEINTMVEKLGGN